MGQKNAINKKNYEHVDFSELLNELQGVKSEEVSDEMNVQAEPDNDDTTIIQESKFRHRIMSDQKIHYLYSGYEKILHEKHCVHAKTIPDEKLQWSEELVHGLQVCPECEITAYIRYGAKDPEETDTYMQFFEKTKITTEWIRKLFVDYGMKTRIYPDIMTVWDKQDTWRIKALPQKGHVQLYHNNYVIRKNGVREFTNGFHLQNLSCEDTDITNAIKQIHNYEYIPEEWAYHQNNREKIEKINKQHAQKEEENALSLEELLANEKERKTVWSQIKNYFRSMFRKKTVFDTYGFQMVSDHGYPKNKTLCIYIWKNKNEELFWQMGIYNQKAKQFSVKYGDAVYAVKQTKVIAWKKVTAETMKIKLE